MEFLVTNFTSTCPDESALTCSANGKYELHRIKKEKHDEEGNGGPNREEEGLG